MSSIELSDYSPDNRPITPDTDIPRNEVALPPVDRGFGAWSFLIAALLVEIVTWGLPSAYGVLLAYYLREPEYANQKNASNLLPLIGTLSSGINYCSGPLIFPLISRYPAARRGMIWGGAVIMCASLFASSYVRKAGLLLLLQGVMYAVGGSLLYAPTIAYISEWFFQRRGLAYGLIFAGTALGGLFLPLLLPTMLKKWGMAPTLRILSIAIAGTLVLSLPFLRGRLPHARVRANPTITSDRRWIRTPLFWIFMLTNLLQGLAFFVPILWLPSFAVSMRLSSTQSSIAVSVLNGASVIGRLALGVFSDRYSAWLLALLTLSSASGIVFIFWGVLAHNLGGICAFGLLYGAVAGGWSSLSAGLVRFIAKDDPALTNTLFGFYSFTTGIGYILSTPISTALSRGGMGEDHTARTGFDVGGGKYQSMIVYVGICFAGAAMVSILGWRVTEKAH